MMLRNAVLLILLVFLQPEGALAQNVTLDQGTFVVHLSGRQVGLESFAIRRSGSGNDARVIAAAEIRLELPDGPLRIDPALEAAGSSMRVAAYQVKVSGTQGEEIAMSANAERLVARARTQRGEQVREYRATPATLVLDRWVAHQYYFLHSRLTSGLDRIQVIVPREGQQLRLRIAEVQPETISLAGQEVSARRIRLEDGDNARHVWLDEDGRVLRVIAGDYRAERQEPPS